MDRSDTSLAFETYWRSLRAERAMPGVADFDPLAIPDLVPSLFELYVQPGDSVPSTIRLAGGDIVSATTVEVTDTDYFSYFQDALKGPTMKRLQLISSQPAGLCQINPLDLGRNTRVLMELTGFPFQSIDHDIAVFGTAVQVNESRPAKSSAKPDLKKATNRIWIDVGAGVPLEP